MSQEESLKDKWERMQKRTFTRWMNNNLRKKRYTVIEDLVTDLDTGIKWLELMHCLFNREVPRHNKNPKMRPHKLDNLEIALREVEQAGVKLHFVRPAQFVDGDAKMILGAIWSTIYFYQLQGISVEELSAKEGLLLWVRKRTAGYANVDVKDFTKSWVDGLAFNALLHSYRQDLLNYDQLSGENAEQNLTQAFTLAEDKLGIPRLLDTEDLLDGVPDERSVMTYVSEWYHYFASQEQRLVAGRRIAKLISINKSNQELQQGYESRAGPLKDWIQQATANQRNHDFGESVEDVQGCMAQQLEFRRERASKLSEKVEAEGYFTNLQATLRLNQRPPYQPPAGLSPADIDAEWSTMSAAEQERNAAMRATLREREEAEIMLRKWASSTRKFALRSQLLKEEASDAVRDAQSSHTVEAVYAARDVLTSLDSEKAALQQVLDEMKVLSGKLQEKNLNEQKYTEQTLDTVSFEWESVLQALSSASDSIAQQVERQEENEKLRVAFAQAANSFADWAQSHLSKLNEQADGDIDEQIAATRQLASQVQEHAADFDALRQANEAVEEAGILENQHTSHSFEGLSSVWDQLEKLAAQKVKTLESAKFSQSSKLSADQLAEIQEAFRHFDKDKSGSLYDYEMKACISSLGQDVSDAQMAGVMEKWDQDKDGKIQFNEFCEFMVERMQDADNADQISAAFKEIAGDKSFVTEAELRAVLDEENVAYIIANMPKLGDDGYDYQAFVSSCYAQV